MLVHRSGYLYTAVCPVAEREALGVVGKGTRVCWAVVELNNG
jgi:hypothetical protein